MIISLTDAEVSYLRGILEYFSGSSRGGVVRDRLVTRLAPPVESAARTRAIELIAEAEADAINDEPRTVVDLLIEGYVGLRWLTDDELRDDLATSLDNGDPGGMTLAEAVAAAEAQR